MIARRDCSIPKVMSEGIPNWLVNLQLIRKRSYLIHRRVSGSKMKTDVRVVNPLLVIEKQKTVFGVSRGECRPENLRITLDQSENIEK